MGMSASQARLLSLTARQSNLEFEGQQINQQRTNLSNQSASYYNSLLTMKVPTPPSTDDYTTVKYTFVIGGNDATISQVLPQNVNGSYMVQYNTNLTSVGIQENQAYKVTASAKESSQKKGDVKTIDNSYVYDKNLQYYTQTFRKNNDGEFAIINNETTGYASRIDENTTFYDKYGNEVSKSKAMDGSTLKDGYTALVAKKSNEQGYSTVMIQLADKAAVDKAVSERGEIVRSLDEDDLDHQASDLTTIQTMSASNNATFSTVGSEYADAFKNAGLNIEDYLQYQSNTGVRFALKSDVERSANNDTLNISTSAVASLTKTHTTTLNNVQIEFDTAGRISSMTDEDGNKYTMTTNTVTDDAAYEDAYNKYTYDQYLYDQKQNEINAHIELLQAQDKNLELRLSQLNTEHSAIQTEMDAVNKVLSKNIESSFKTFNA